MKLYCIIALSLLLRPETATAQQEESITLSLQQAIEIAQENSPEARRCVKMRTFFFYAQSPDFHKQGLCYYLKILYL